MGGLKSSHYVRTVFRENRAIYYLAVLAAVVLSAGCDGGSGSSGQVEPTPTASATVPQGTLTPTAEPPTPQPSVTAMPTRPPAPTESPAPTQPPAPTTDTRVAIMDRPTVVQI